MIEQTVFNEVGVFVRTVSGRGEDTDLFSRIERAGIAAWYIPTAIVQHLTPPERLPIEVIDDHSDPLPFGHAPEEGRQGPAEETVPGPKLYDAGYLGTDRDVTGRDPPAGDFPIDGQ